MADLSPPDDLVAPPNDLVDAGGPPADLATAVQPLAPSEVQDLGKTSALGAAGRGVVRGAAPAAGGLAAAAAGAEAGAGLGALTGPAAPLAVPILSFAGGLGGAYLGAEGVQRLQDAALAHMPESWRRALGQDTATQREDIQQHPYASLAGELAPNLALMRPGKIATAIPEGAGMLRRALSSPTAARLTSAGLMGAQEAGSEEAQQGTIDPGKVAIAAGAGAVMNRPTSAGEAVMSAATAPQRVLTNIARGRPADTPIVPPEAVQPPNDLMPEGAPAPQGHPAPGEAVGVRFKNAPPRRAEVDHYFDNGNAVRLRMDDGSYHDMTTADLAKSRTEPPQPMPRPVEIQGKPPADVGMDEAPFPDDWYEPQGQPRPASKPTLGADMLNALDHADTLERTAMNGSLNLSAGARQDMLAEAGRLRRLFGHAGDETTMYHHPMAGEPARDLGELAAARTEAPQLYEGERRVPPPQPPAPGLPGMEGRPAAPPGVDPYALEDVSTARAPMPKGESLFDAIRALGGIKDDRGDVAQIMQGFKNEPFKRRVLNPKGLAPDAIREALQEQGWFGNHDRFGPDALETGSYPGDDIRDLYDLMDREARGEKVYHPDSDTAQQMAYRQYLDEELSRAGVLHTDSNEQAARKLAQYRADRDADQHAWETSRAVEDDLHPEDLEALTGHGYEPGSDFGAELEEPSGHEGDTGRSPPADLIAPEDHGGGEQVAGGGEGPAEAHPSDRPDLGPSVIPPLRPHEGSWAIIDRDTGKAVAEIHRSDPSINHLNTERYQAVPIAEYLSGLSKPEATRFQMPRVQKDEETGFDFERGTAVDGQGRPVDQFINEAGAHSAKQLAAAREAQGHGKIKSGAQQRGAGPLFGEEEPPEPEQGSLFQVHENKPFYSALTRGVEGLRMERAPASQWLSTIKNLPGVKSEEVDWSGLPEWLSSQTKPVTKDEVLQHLRENEVQVKEVEHTDHPARLRVNNAARELQDHLIQNEHFDAAGARRYAEDAMRGELSAGQLRMQSPRARELSQELQEAYEGRELGRVANPTKYSKYTLPGGESYRELLLTLPKKETGLYGKAAADAYNHLEQSLHRKYGDGIMNKATPEELARLADLNRRSVQSDPNPSYRSSHWDEPNVLAHIRFDDRTGPNGEKILHMAEVQSDWHQAGRRKGYKKSPEEQERTAKAVEDARLAHIAMMEQVIHDASEGKYRTRSQAQDAGDLETYRKIERALQTDERLKQTQAAYDTAWEANKVGAVPDAPFKTSWHELALKRMLRYAAEHGYDRLSWDTGDTNAERYDLSKQVDRIEYFKNPDQKTYQVDAYKDDNRVLNVPSARESDLEGIVGKDVAKRIVDGHGLDKNGVGTLTGENLKVGGEGMRGFYDRILPQTANKLAKKWGAKVEPSEIEQVGALGPGHYKKEPVHSIPITPAMRESVMGGQPLFQRSFGRAGEAKGETVKLADDLIGRTLGNVSPPEAKLLNEIERMAEKIVPRASVRVMRALRMEPGMAAEAGVHPDSRISGATYANGLRRLIALSLESPNIRGTLKHEAVHYLRARGLISGKEWAALERAAVKGDWLGKHDVENRWATAPAWLQKEEAIAEEFSQWRRAPDAVPKMFRPMYERISRFMAKIADHTRRIFGRDVTADDVMSRIMSGEVGGRNRQEVERTEPAFAQAHLPADMNEAGDRLDSAADDMAGELHGAPPGTYRRTLDRMMPPMGELVFKDPNAVQNVTLRPETMARLDSRSAAVWNTWKAKENEAATMVDDLRSRIADTMLKLNDTERNKVYAARELDRINNFTRTDTGHQIVVRNEGADFAHFSKPGDVVTLSPKETAAYHALTDMFDRSWKNVMEGAARKVGYTGEWDKDDMAANIQRLNETAANTADRGNAKVAARAAKIVAALDEQRRQGYHPLMRFGDYYAHVTPKMGTDEMSSGGFPRTVRFELAERRLQDSLTGGTRVGNQSPPYAKEMLDRLRAQYPADRFNIEHGYLAKNPEMLDRVDLPAIEKLMTFMENDMLHSLRQEARGRGMSKADARDYAKEKYDDLYGRMVDQLWEKAFKELESGYKKKSRTIPGYSQDFDRALGTYMHWTSRNVADQIHRERVDDAFTAMQTDPRVNADVKRYWNNWRDYQSQPSNIFNKGVNGMARWGFLTAMGLNPSSTAVVGAHGLFMAGPTLSVGIGTKALPAYFKALSHALGGMKVDGGGLHIDDVGLAARTPAEKTYLAKLDQEGMLHSRAIEDMAALNEKQSSLWGSARSQARKIMDMALSNVSVMDRANRIASALSSYRLAQDPATMAAMDKAWSSNQIWRDIKAKDGITPETMSRFMLSNMVGEYGRTNQAPIERNAISRMMLGMHGFVTRLLQAMWKMGSMGPEGQKALLWTLGAFWTMAGVDGIPFSQDVQNFADYLWKKATGKDPMIGYRIQAELASMFGKPGADMILHGPASVFSGVDVASRLGLGDLLSRNIPNPDNMLGAYPSIILGRAMAANSLIRSGQYEAAAAQAFPAGIRNLIVADAERRNGIRTRAGRPLVQQENVGAPETVARGLGFTPEKAERRYQANDFRYRAKHSRMGAPPNPIPQSKGGRSR